MDLRPAIVQGASVTFTAVRSVEDEQDPFVCTWTVTDETGVARDATDEDVYRLLEEFKLLANLALKDVAEPRLVTVK